MLKEEDVHNEGGKCWVYWGVQMQSDTGNVCSGVNFHWKGGHVPV